MFLPIGHQDSYTRRKPWATGIIVAACLAAWLATLHARSQLDVLPPEHYQVEADRYWRAHPYLEPEARLTYYMLTRDRPDLLREDGDAVVFTEQDFALWLFNARLGEKGERPRDPQRIVSEQEALDLLILKGFYLEPEQIRPEEPVPAERFGLIPAAPKVHAFLTHMFMHGSWAHVLGNMFMLFLAGPALEDRWGRPLYTLFYLLTGLFAAAFYWVLSMDSAVPMVGASGAVSGALGAFLVLFWSTKIRFFYYFFPIKPFWGTFLVPAWVALPLWFGNEATNAWLSHVLEVPTQVAYWAHVGGFLAGVLFATTLRGFRLEERYLAERIDRKVTIAASKASQAQVREWIGQCRYDEAEALIDELAKAQPDDLDVRLLRLESGVAAFHPDRGAPGVADWITSRISKGRVREAAEAWNRAVEISPGFGLEPERLIELVPTLGKVRGREIAILALQHVLSAEHGAIGARVVFRAVDLAQKLDPSIERGALRRALDLPELPAPKRERLEAAIAKLERSGAAECPDPLAESRRQARRGDVADVEGRVPIEVEEFAEDEGLEISRFENACHEHAGSPAPTIADDELAIGGALDEPRFASLKCVEVTPVGFDGEQLVVEAPDGRRARLDLGRVDAIAAAIVGGLAARPVLVIDLLRGFGSTEGGTLSTIRLRSDRLDPRRLGGGDDVRGIEAIRGFLRRLVERTGATPLPAADAVVGGAFARYAELGEYERDVLGVGG